MFHDKYVFSLEGEDHLSFLQGLVTQDIQKLAQGSLAWGGFLTAQGRLKYFLFFYKMADRILIECPAQEAEEFLTLLKRFKLRSKIEIKKTEYQVFSAFSQEEIPQEAVFFARDPRSEKIGWRGLYLASQQEGEGQTQKERDYLEKRLSLGLPEQEDIRGGDSLVLEMNMDYLHGVSWEKGCYIGQEVTARTHYRGLIKKRLFPISLSEGSFLGEERKILNKDGKEIGELRSFLKGHALALLHRQSWEEERLFYQGKEMTIHHPDWFSEEMKKKKEES